MIKVNLKKTHHLNISTTHKLRYENVSSSYLIYMIEKSKPKVMDFSLFHIFQNIFHLSQIITLSVQSWTNCYLAELISEGISKNDKAFIPSVKEALGSHYEINLN